jgi:hypothetical protein
MRGADHWLLRWFRYKIRTRVLVVLQGWMGTAVLIIFMLIRVVTVRVSGCSIPRTSVTGPQ